MTEFIERKALPLLMAFVAGFLVAPDDRDKRYRLAKAVAECQQGASAPADGIAAQHYAETNQAAEDNNNPHGGTK